MDQPEGLDQFFAVLLALVPGGLWCLYWLLAVNWRRLGPVLAQGAWAPVVLLMLVTASVWSRISPTECTVLDSFVVPNFWWQLGSVATLVAVALFCGWLQIVWGCAPAEYAVEPQAHAEHDHGHH